MHGCRRLLLPRPRALRPWALAAAAAVALSLVVQVGSHPPDAASRGGKTLSSVLLVSDLSEADDRNVIRSLEATLQGAGGQPRWHWRRLGLDIDRPEAELAAEVRQALQKEPQALVVTTTAGMADLVAKQTRQHPILFRMASDPIGMCLVGSLRKPGGQATGYTSNVPVESKQIEALVMSYPAIQTVVMLTDDEFDNNEDWCDPTADTSRPPPRKPCAPGWTSGGGFDGATASLALGAGRAVRFLRLCTRQDVDRLSTWLRPRSAMGLVVPYTSFYYLEVDAVVQAARRLQLPAVYRDPDAISLGGLMAVAPLGEPAGRARGIEQVRRLLAGVAPADIPVQRPEGLTWTLNLRAARESGLVPSKSALRAADHLVH